MIIHKNLCVLFLFLFKFVTITNARIDPTNIKREAPVITEEVVTHTKTLIPNELPQPPPFPVQQSFPVPLNIEEWRACNTWCRLKMFLTERNIIRSEFQNRQRRIKDQFQSVKIPGLFTYNSLLKRQKDIASRINELQKTTELTAHLYRPLFQLLMVLLPTFGPNLSPVLSKNFLPPPPPSFDPKAPHSPHGYGPPNGPIGISRPIIPQGPNFEPGFGPKGPPPPPQPVIIPKGHFNQPLPPHPLEQGPISIPKPPVPQFLQPLGPTPTPFPFSREQQIGGYDSIPIPQPLIDNRQASATREEPTPLPAPPIPSPYRSSTPQPIPPQPYLSIVPPSHPRFANEGNPSEIIIALPSSVGSLDSHPTPLPSQVFRGESGIVSASGSNNVSTTVSPSSSKSSTTNTIIK